MYNLDEHSMGKILDVWKFIEILTPARCESLERYFKDTNLLQNDRLEFEEGLDDEEHDQIFPLKNEPYQYNNVVNNPDDKKIPVIFWHAYMGYIDWQKAEVYIQNVVDRLCGKDQKAFNEFRPRNVKMVPVMAFIMNQKHELNYDSVIISSAAWALGKIMNPNFTSENIDDILNYDTNYRQIVDKIISEIQELSNNNKPNSDPENFLNANHINITKASADTKHACETSIVDNSVIVMNIEKINYFIRRVMEELDIPDNLFLKQPDVCIRKVFYAKIKNLNQTFHHDTGRITYDISQFRSAPLDMFNSFFLEEINLIKRNLNNLGDDSVVKRYLGGGTKFNSCDVLQNTEQFLNLLMPMNYSYGRWPASPNRSLSALQAAALQGILDKNSLSDNKCFAVNGPPGTGKTTLLADLIANIYIQRADELVKLTSPFDGFDPNKIRFKALNDFEYTFQKLNPNLQGFEIVVASTNNAAVENISKELPLMSKIDERYQNHLDYFGWIMDTKELQGKNWGAIAAVLGNSSNRKNFIHQFWDNFPDTTEPKDVYKTYHMRNYLNYFKRLAASEFNHTDFVYNKTKHFVPKPFSPEVFEDGSVTFDDVILEQWREAQLNFEMTKHHIEFIYGEISDLIKDYKSDEDYSNEKIILQKRIIELEQSLETNLLMLKDHQSKYDEMNDEILVIKQRKISFYLLRKFLQTQTYTNYITRIHERYKSLKYVQELKHNLETKCTGITVEIQHLKTRLDKIDDEQYRVKDRWNILVKNLSLPMSCDEFVAQFIDINFDDEFHLKALSSIPALEDLKSKLFIAAVKMHELFIYANANTFWNNLNFFFHALKNPQSVEQEYINIAWKSFFMMVPVVSTTFHSFGNLLQSFGHEEIGWLLIDEAGQVVPQYAVGALYRSKKAIVMGDPQQTQPVSVLGRALLSKLYKKFNIKEQDWSPADVSVQNLADRNSFYQTQYVDGIPIGFPLLVHRRCQEPMFSICNTLSYNNMMISAVQNRNSALTDILGFSRWIHVEDINVVQGQYESMKELQHLQALLNKLLWRENGIDLLNKIYIVTFFKDYKDFIKLQLCKIYKDKRFKSVIHIFCENNVGTVHAFQGKENDTVILMLGAQSATDKGARTNMVEKPNVLNVAISRAQNNIYVIGNEDIWLEFDNIKTVHSFLKDYSASPYDDYRQVS